MLGGVPLRRLIQYIAFIVLILVLLPSFIVSIWGWLKPPPSNLDSPFEVSIYITSTAQVVIMPLEEYVIGVVAAEMPALFSPAALEAQAVAARTYAVRRAQEFGGSGCSLHSLADVCDDPAHCQAYLPLEALQLKWGLMDYNENYARVRQAVKNTAGLVLTYRGQVIDPIFHSTCGGHTEDADKVWSNPFSYLTGVECSYCSHSPRFNDTKVYSHGDFIASLKQMDGAIAVTTQVLSKKNPPLTVQSRSESGRVLELAVGNRTLKGTEVRKALGLNSTNFTLDVSLTEVTVSTVGYGHGVGLCQYGADGMGQAGYDFREILAHYYQGIHLTALDSR